MEEENKNKKLRRENNKIVEEENKNEKKEGLVKLCAQCKNKDNLSFLTILVESLI